MRRHTAAHTRQESHTGHSRMRRRHGNPGITSSHRGPDDGRQTSGYGTHQKPRRPEASRPCPGEPPRTTRQHATAQHTPPTPVGPARQREWRRAARPMQWAPDECGLARAALQPTMSSTSTNPTNPPNLSKILPRAPGEGHAPRGPAIHQRQGRGWGHRHGPVLPPNFPLSPAGNKMDRAKRSAKHAGPTGWPMTTGMLYRAQPAPSSPGIRTHNRERYFQGQGVKGYVRHWSRHAPPRRKLNTKAPGHRAPTTALLGQLLHM